MFSLGWADCMCRQMKRKTRCEVVISSLQNLALLSFGFKGLSDWIALDAVIRAVVEHTDGLRLQVDFGNEQTALIHTWQVVPVGSRK